MGVPATPSGSRPEDGAASVSTADAALIPNARRNSFWSFTFWGEDLACERRYVRDLFASHGFSVGRRQRGALTGVMFGDFDIQKWRNLRPSDRDTLHGRINEDSLPITASFPSGLPDQIDDALLALSHEDWARRQASAIEARRAETENTGSVHESAIPNGETPNE
jgi:hypothetical protein